MSTDGDVDAAQHLLAVKEGIFSEPAGATDAAGLMRVPNEGLIGPQVAVVALITGVGFKDSESVECAIRPKPASRMTIDEWEEVLGAVKGHTLARTSPPSQSALGPVIEVTPLPY